MQKEIWQWNLLCSCGCDKLSYFTDHFKIRISTNIARLLVPFTVGRGQWKCDGTHAETRFRLLAKWTSLLKSVGASIQLTTGSRSVHISSSNAGYTMFRGSVKGTGYPLHLPVSPSLLLLCVPMCHHISSGVY
jgi:hypothetical protein